MVVWLFLLNYNFRLLLWSTLTSEEPGVGSKWEHTVTGGPKWTEVDRGGPRPRPADSARWARAAGAARPCGRISGFLA